MYMYGLFCCVASLLLAGSCLACQPPDCDHPDCGTCGNACCCLELKFEQSAPNLYDTFVKSFKSGGVDGRYRFVNGSDLRPYKIPNGAQFILQAVHTTLVHHYNDTLNFVLASNSSASTTVRAFSVSQIANAYCDAGQNYKNLVGFVKALGEDYSETKLFGCPNPKSAT